MINFIGIIVSVTIVISAIVLLFIPHQKEDIEKLECSTMNIDWIKDCFLVFCGDSLTVPGYETKDYSYLNKLNCMECRYRYSQALAFCEIRQSYGSGGSGQGGGP